MGGGRLKDGIPHQGDLLSFRWLATSVNQISSPPKAVFLPSNQSPDDLFFGRHTWLSNVSIHPMEGSRRRCCPPCCTTMQFPPSRPGWHHPGAPPAKQPLDALSNNPYRVPNNLFDGPLESVRRGVLDIESLAGGNFRPVSVLFGSRGTDLNHRGTRQESFASSIPDGGAGFDDFWDPRQQRPQESSMQDYQRVHGFPSTNWYKFVFFQLFCTAIFVIVGIESLGLAWLSDLNLFKSYARSLLSIFIYHCRSNNT